MNKPIKLEYDRFIEFKKNSGAFGNQEGRKKQISKFKLKYKEWLVTDKKEFRKMNQREQLIHEYKYGASDRLSKQKQVIAKKIWDNRHTKLNGRIMTKDRCNKLMETYSFIKEMSTDGILITTHEDLSLKSNCRLSKTTFKVRIEELVKCGLIEKEIIMVGRVKKTKLIII